MNGDATHRRYALLAMAMLAGCGCGEPDVRTSFDSTKAANEPTQVVQAPVDESPSHTQSPIDGGPDPSDVAVDQPINATLVADLREMPRMKGAELRLNEKSGILYSVAAPFETVVDFCLRTLAEAGWQENEPDRVVEERATHFQFAKQGCSLSLWVIVHDTQDGVINVGLINQGNADTRELPRHDDAILLESSYASTDFVTAANRSEVVEFCRKELPALGWQEYSEPATNHSDFEFEVLTFKKNGTGLRIYVGEHPKHPRKTAVFYSVGVPRDDLPVPQGAKDVVFGGLDLTCEVSAKSSEILEFYRAELATLGWTEKRSGANGADSSAPIEFGRADGKRITLEFAESENGATQVWLEETE